MKDIAALLNQAQQFSMQSEEEQARMILLEILENEPENIAALLMLGGSYFTSEKYQEAEMAFERLVLLAPGRGQCSIALFNCLWIQDRKEEALEEISRFMRIADRDKEQVTIAQYVKMIEQIGL